MHPWTGGPVGRWAALRAALAPARASKVLLDRAHGHGLVDRKLCFVLTAHRPLAASGREELLPFCGPL